MAATEVEKAQTCPLVLSVLILTNMKKKLQPKCCKNNKYECYNSLVKSLCHLKMCELYVLSTTATFQSWRPRLNVLSLKEKLGR